MARAVTRVTCLGSACGHQAKPRDTRHSTGGGICDVSWLCSWAPSKASWHASCVLTRLVRTMQGPVARVMCLGSTRGHHARPHGTCHGTGGSRVLARLVGTMQGPVTRVMARAVARITCLDSTCGHQVRPRGTRHGTGGGTRHMSWLNSWLTMSTHHQFRHELGGLDSLSVMQWHWALFSFIPTQESNYFITVWKFVLTKKIKIKTMVHKIYNHND